MIKKVSPYVLKYAGLCTFLLCILFYFLPFKPKAFGDGEYHEGTLQLVQYIAHGFTGEVGVTKGLMTLFYYLIPYSLFQYFHSDHVLYIAGVTFNSLAVSYAVHVLFKTFKLIPINERIQVLVFILLNLFPIHIYYSMGILAEAAAFLFSTLFVYYLVKIYTQQANPRDFILLTLVLTCFISVRPNFAPFLLFFLILIPFIKITRAQKLTVLASLLIFVGLFYMTEKKLDHSDAEFKKHQFVKGTIWSRYELRDEPFNWLPQHAKDEFASIDYKNNLAKRAEILNYCEANHLDVGDYAFNWMLNDMKEHPILTARQFLFKYVQSQTFVITPLMKSNNSPWIKWGIHIYINVLNYILLLSIFYSVFLYVKNRKQLAIYLPLLLFYATAFATIFFLHSEQRYVFPTRPAVLFMLAMSVNYWWSKRQALASTN